MVDLRRALAGGLVVAPQDVGGAAAEDRVGAVAAEQLVAARGAPHEAAAVVLVHSQDTVDAGPPVVARVGGCDAAGEQCEGRREDDR